MPKQLFLWFLLLLSGTGLFAQQTMNTMVNFPVNGHELDVTAQAELDQTLKSLELPFHSYRIEIIGHTDADGDLGLNAALSGRRARSVRNWLSHRGVPHFAMETVSEGELKPLSSNASEPGKARNRRVELRFVPNANAHRNPFGKSEPFMETTFDATEAANFTYKPSGSRISIPGNSLVHADGTTVQGKVTYKYREWRDPVQFLLSDIVMDYPRAGSGQHFNSGGMFELRAYQDGEELFLASGRRASVKFAIVDSSQYDLFAYNADNRSWNAPNVNTPVNANGITGIGGPVPNCIETAGYDSTMEDANKFLAAIDSGLAFLNGPMMQNALEASRLPSFEYCWGNKGYAGTDYIADLPTGQWEDYLGLSVSITPARRRRMRRKGMMRLRIQDRLGRNPELAAIKHVEMYISESKYKSIAADFTRRKFADVRIKGSRSSWMLTFKEPGRFSKLRVQVRQNRRKRTQKRISPMADYRNLLAERKRAYYENDLIRLRNTFWTYSKPLMEEQDERCMTKDQWLYFFSKNRKQMKVRYTAAKDSMAGNPDRAQAFLRQSLVDLNDRYNSGVSASLPPPPISAFYSDTLIGTFMNDLSIGGFGIWNCDQIMRLKKPVEIFATYRDETGTELNMYTISVIDERINGVLNYGNGWYSVSTLALDPESTLALVGVDQRGERFLLRGDDIRNMGLRNRANESLVMQQIPSDIDSSEELRALIYDGKAESLGMR